MPLSKSEFLRHVIDAIGPSPDPRPIKQVFERLPSPLKNTFNDCDKFGAFIMKRPHLFDYHLIGKTIVIRKKSELTDDSQSSKPSTSNESTNQNMPMSKQQSLNSSLSNSSDFDFEKMDMKHLGRRGAKQFMEIVISRLKTEGIVRLPIKDLFEIVMFETGASMNFDQFCEFIANRSNVFDLFKIDGAIYVSNKEKNRSNLQPYLPMTTKEVDAYISDLKMGQSLTSNMGQQNFDIVVRKYMNSHLDSQHMFIQHVGKGARRRMALFYNTKMFPEYLNIEDFVDKEEYYRVPGGINLKSMVETLKIEDILMDFITFLASHPAQEWKRIRDFNNPMTEEECFHYGLTKGSAKNYDILLAIFELFPNLFIISGSTTKKARLKEDDSAFWATLDIANTVLESSSLAVFNTLPKYCKAKFVDYSDFCTFFLKYKLKIDLTSDNTETKHSFQNDKLTSSKEVVPSLDLTMKSIISELQTFNKLLASGASESIHEKSVEVSFRNHWKEIRHSLDNSVIHFEDGRLYLLFKFETFPHLSLEDINNSPYFFCVPNVGFHFKPVIDQVNLDKLLVKFIRFIKPREPGCTQWVTKKQIIDGYVGILFDFPDTDLLGTLTAIQMISLIETIIDLFPSIWKTKTQKWGSGAIKLVNDEPECQPTRERLILEILRAEQIAKPTSMKLLFETLPDFAKEQFNSPVKLQEFCQEIVALKDEFTFLQEEHQPSTDLTMKSIHSELQTLAKVSESIDENSSEDLQRFIRQLSLLSKKAEAFGQKKNEEFLCQELAPTGESIGDDSVIEI